MFHFRSSYRKAPPQVLLENHFCLNIEVPRRYCRAIPSSREDDLPPGCFPPLAPAHLSHVLSTDRSHHHSHLTRPSKGSRAALVGARGARTSSKPTHTPRPRSLRSGPVRGTGQGESLQPSPHPPLLHGEQVPPQDPNLQAVPGESSGVSRRQGEGPVTTAAASLQGASQHLQGAQDTAGHKGHRRTT